MLTFSTNTHHRTLPTKQRGHETGVCIFILHLIEGMIKPLSDFTWLGEAVLEKKALFIRLGKVCSHVAAVCFVVEAHTRQKEEAQSPTDAPCQWLAPRLKRVMQLLMVNFKLHS